MQWLQDTHQRNVDNLSNVRHQANRHFQNKAYEYVKAKIGEMYTNSKIQKSEICIGASMNLRTVTSLELI
jgi:hypothetical protein